MEHHAFRTARKPHWCGTRAAIDCTHLVEAGHRYLYSVLSPHHDDLGNEGWWHTAMCIHCAAHYGHVEVA